MKTLKDGEKCKDKDVPIIGNNDIHNDPVVVSGCRKAVINDYFSIK